MIIHETIILFLYLYMCNFTISALRATIMAIVLLFAPLVRREYDALSSIGFAGIICLLVNPLSAFDAGFLMSFACVVGIAILFKPIKSALMSMKMPKWLAESIGMSVATNVSLIFIMAFFFENDNDTIPEVYGSRRVLAAADSGQSEQIKGDGVVYNAKPVYLRPGQYRIKVAAGPYIWWKSITVDNEAVSASLDLRSYASRSITVHGAALDAETGERLTLQTKFSVLYRNKWIPLNSLDKDTFKTGTVWKFKASCPGYQDEIFSLRIDWYQDELFITAGLHKDNSGED